MTSERETAMELFYTEFTKEKVATELYRRDLSDRVSRWAMITRKMKKQEPSGCAVINYTTFLRENDSNRTFRYSTALPGLIALLCSRNKDELKTATLFLWNAVEHLQNTIDKTIMSELISALLKIISSEKYERSTIGYALGVMNGITGIYWYNDLVVETGVIPILVKLMSSAHIYLVDSASRILYSIYGTSGDTGELCRTACISAGAIPVVKELCEHTGISEYTKEHLSRMIRHYEKIYS